MTHPVAPKGRCPAWKNGMRCRLEFAHPDEHMAHKDGITWTRDESDAKSYEMDFGVNVLADPASDLEKALDPYVRPETKDYSQ